MNDAANRLGVAAHRKLRAQDELRAANAELADAIRHFASVGIPKCRIGAWVRRDLQLHGFGSEQISRLGLSDGNVRVILDRA